MSENITEGESSSSGPSRRTIVKGAAWAVPAITASVAVPWAAASAGPEISFTTPPPPIGACGASSGAVVRVTDGSGNPAPAGTVVTVTLPSGLVWADSLTGGPRALSTDANGQVTLSGASAINATGTSGNFTITATAEGVSTQAVLAVSPATDGNVYYTPWGAPTPVTLFTGFPNAKTLAVGGGVVFGITEDGKWVWQSMPVGGTTPAFQVTGIPGDTVDKIYASTPTAYGWAIADGDVYYLLPPGSLNKIDGLSNITDLATFATGTYAKDTSGHWFYYLTDFGLSQVTGTPGDAVDKVYADAWNADYPGWAISDGNVYLSIRGGAPTQVVGLSNITDLATGGNNQQIAAKDTSGNWWVYNTLSKTVTQITPTPAGGVDKIFVGIASNISWALAGGQVYYTISAGPATLADGLSNVVNLTTGDSTNVFAQTADGQWWRLVPGASWQQVTGTPGNTVASIYQCQAETRGWAIATPAPCVTSTTTPAG